MPSIIKTKLSPTPGKVPLIADLASGELAVNTNDAILFMKKTVGGVDSVVRVGAEMSPLLAGALKETTGAAFLGAMGYQGRVLRAAQAATGLSAIEELSIPTWANHIQVMIFGLDVSVADPLVQIGDSGGFETTGYFSSSNSNGSTDGFIMACTTSDVLYGVMNLYRASADGTKWAASHGARRSTANSVGGGTKTLSAALDRVRVWSSGAFSAGEVMVAYQP